MVECYDEGEVVIKQREPGMHMFVILEGDADMYINAELSDAVPFDRKEDLGKKVRISQLREGEQRESGGGQEGVRRVS